MISMMNTYLVNVLDIMFIICTIYVRTMFTYQVMCTHTK
jgi:hypothetical protein